MEIVRLGYFINRKGISAAFEELTKSHSACYDVKHTTISIHCPAFPPSKFLGKIVSQEKILLNLLALPGGQKLIWHTGV